MLVKVAMPDKFRLKVIPNFRSVIFPSGGDIHYIGGADILPVPLEEEEESQMISMLSGEDNEEAKKKNACKEILRTYDFYSFFFYNVSRIACFIFTSFLN